MDKLTTFTGLVAPLDMSNVDTDQLVPKQFLKRVERSGFGQFLFFNQRFRPDGSPDPRFVLNLPRYAGASILLAPYEFGTGSSREHAPWAIKDYGFRVVIAERFADIFRNNAFNNGLLLIELQREIIDEWFRRVEPCPGYRLTVDLPSQTLTGQDGFACFFSIDPFHKRRLLEGLDDIDITLNRLPAIETYEASHSAPWRAAVSAPQEVLQ